MIRKLVNSFIGEFFATFLYVFISTGSVSSFMAYNECPRIIPNCTIDQKEITAASHVGVALASGFIVISLIHSLSKLSCAHMNPVISIAMLFVKRMSMIKCVGYIVSQIAGSIAGSYMSKAVSVEYVPIDGIIIDSVPLMKRFGMELVLTVILVFTVLETTTTSKIEPSAAMAVGMIFVANTIIGLRISGAYMNPARSLGNSIVSNQWNDHWYLWVAPMTGALVGCILNSILHYVHKTVGRKHDPDSDPEFDAPTCMTSSKRTRVR